MVSSLEQCNFCFFSCKERGSWRHYLDHGTQGLFPSELCKVLTLHLSSCQHGSALCSCTLAVLLPEQSSQPTARLCTEPKVWPGQLESWLSHPGWTLPKIWRNGSPRSYQSTCTPNGPSHLALLISEKTLKLCLANPI